MSEASKHFEQAVRRAEMYDSGMAPETHLARGLVALALQVDRIEQALSSIKDGGGHN